MISSASGEVHDLSRGRGSIDVIVEPPLVEGEFLEWEDGFILVDISCVPSAISLDVRLAEETLTHT